MLKRKIVFGILLCVLLAFNIMFIDYEPFALLVFCIAFVIIQYVMIYIASKKIEVEVDMPTNIVAGNGDTQIVVKVRNRSNIHITKLMLEVKCRYMNTGEAVAADLIFSLKSKDEQAAIIDMDIKYSGNIYVSVRKAILYDTLMIFKKRVYCLKSKSINVIPKLFIPQDNNTTRNIYSGGTSDIYSQYNRGDDTSEIFDLRNYTEGDRINRIHWKLTSKSDDVIVKDYSSQIILENVVLVDMFYEKDIEQLETVYELLYSFAKLMISNEKPLIIMYMDMRIGELVKEQISSEKEVEDMISNILKIPTYTERDKAMKIFDALEKKDGIRLFYITGHGYFKEENYNDEYVKYTIAAGYNNEQECVNKFNLID